MSHRLYNLRCKIKNKLYVLLLKVGFHEPTTKRCSDCGNPRLSEFHSLNEKYCSECETWFSWNLDKGQKRLFSKTVEKENQ